MRVYWLNWLLVPLLAWLSLAALLWLFQRGLLYHPDQAAPDPAEWSLPEFSPTRINAGDDIALFGWWRPPPVPDAPVVLYLHGNAGHLGCRATKFRAFIDAGFGVLAVSWRYNAGAGGEASEANLYADGRAAMRFLEQQSVDTQRVALYGESLGTGVAITLAGEDRAGGLLLLESPYSSIADVARTHYWYIPTGTLLHDKFEMMEKIRAVKIPIFVVHGARDTIIPPRISRRLFAAAPEPKVIHTLPEAGHIDLYEHGAGPLVVAFIKASMPGGKSSEAGKTPGVEAYLGSESVALAAGS